MCYWRTWTLPEDNEQESFNATAACMIKKPLCHIFVYGTLRKDAHHPARQLLIQGAAYAGKASFQGRLYDLGRFPAAVASTLAADRVTGELYRLKSPGETLAQLDAYEGNRFQRRAIIVEDEKRKQIHCWIYLFSGKVSETKRILSGDYVAFLRRR